MLSYFSFSQSSDQSNVESLISNTFISFLFFIFHKKIKAYFLYWRLYKTESLYRMHSAFHPASTLTGSALTNPLMDKDVFFSKTIFLFKWKTESPCWLAHTVELVVLMFVCQEKVGTSLLIFFYNAEKDTTKRVEVISDDSIHGPDLYTQGIMVTLQPNRPLNTTGPIPIMCILRLRCDASYTRIWELIIAP